MRSRSALMAFGLALFIASCSSAPVRRSPEATDSRTAIEIAFAEENCMNQLRGYLNGLKAPRMDSFFAAALNGLVRCEAYSGLAHIPTADITRWLGHANGRPAPGPIPPLPPELAVKPANADDRVPYQRACVAYMRRYLPASIARAGDDPDVAAAFVFNTAEQCDSDAGFATIAPSDLAAIMQAKHLL